MIKKLFTLIALTFLLASGPTLHAQSSESSELQVRPFRNIGVFFRTFVDTDSNIRYLTDDLLLSNQCKKRDIFAIHATKDEISERIIKDYTTLDGDTLAQLKKRYALLTSELKYVRNLDLLSEEQGQDKLDRKVLEHANKDYLADITAELETWHIKYTDSLDRYADCPNSWTQVKDKVETVKTRATEISTAYTKLKKTLRELKDTVADTPAAFYNNTTDTIGDGLKSSWKKTLSNTQEFGRGIRTELERSKLSPDRETFNAIRTAGEQNASAQSLDNLISRESNLIEITNTLRSQQSTADFEQELELLRAGFTVSNNYNDQANTSLFITMYNANAVLTETNTTFAAESQGIVDLAKSIHQKQCRSR